MRRWSSLLIVFLLAATAPSVASGQEGEPSSNVTDDPNDTHIYLPDGTDVGQPPAGYYGSVDILEMGILSETEDLLDFYIEVQELDTDSQTPMFGDDPRYYLYFTYGERNYRIRVFLSLDEPVNPFGSNSGVYARLEEAVGDNGYRYLDSLEAEADFDANRIIIHAPRDMIVDHNQSPPVKGRAFTDLYAESDIFGFFSFPLGIPGVAEVGRVGFPSLYDRAPDSGFGADYVFAVGRETQRGDLGSLSLDPIRWTNGEASTLAFHVIIANQGSKAETVALSTEGIPSDWTVAHSDRLVVPAGGSVNATLLATIPFSHMHGETLFFDFIATSTDSDSFTTTKLGVHWPKIAQPAGHHATLWFHSASFTDNAAPFNTLFPETRGWFNAADKDDTLDQDTPLPAAFVAPAPFADGQGVAYWNIGLEPGLRLGLDFDLDRIGSFVTQINPGTAIVDPALQVNLIHYIPGDSNRGRLPGQGDGQRGTSILLATGKSEPQAGVKTGALDFAVELNPQADADLVPYTADATMYLEVLLWATAVPGHFFSLEQDAPKLFTEATTMVLPLNEYHDPLDTLFQTDGALHLAPTLDGQEKRVNPQKSAIYAFDLHFSGSQAETFVAELSGHNAAWGQIIGDKEFKIEKDGTRVLAVMVTAPSNARDGDKADITLTVRHKKNAAIQAGVGTLTTVTTAEEIPDEAGRGEALAEESTEKGKKAPGIPLVALFALLAAALLVQRRRHHP